MILRDRISTQTEAVAGKTLMLNEYDEDLRAQLEFTDKHDVIHFMYVDPKFIEPCYEPARASPCFY